MAEQRQPGALCVGRDELTLRDKLQHARLTTSFLILAGGGDVVVKSVSQSVWKSKAETQPGALCVGRDKLSLRNNLQHLKLIISYFLLLPPDGGVVVKSVSVGSRAKTHPGALSVGKHQRDLGDSLQQDSLKLSKH